MTMQNGNMEKSKIKVHEYRQINSLCNNRRHLP